MASAGPGRDGRVWLAAGVVFFARTAGLVIAGQLLSGLGGALILPNGLAILGATFTDPHRRTEVITAWAASSGIGLAIGPLVAGALVNHFSWHTVFLSNVMLGLIALAVTLPTVTESRSPGSRLDIAGALLGALTIASLVYACIQGGHDGYSSANIVPAWVLAIAGAVAFVLVERRAPSPMLDLRLFASRSFSAAHGVPAAARGHVVAAVASGTNGARPLSTAVHAAIADSFTSGLHAAFVVNGVVFLVAAVVALLAVHNRPHQNQARPLEAGQ